MPNLNAHGANSFNTFGFVFREVFLIMENGINFYFLLLSCNISYLYTFLSVAVLSQNRFAFSLIFFF